VAGNTVHLPTGIDLYYEVHGEGEPLVLIPSTGFGCNVWQQFQVPELSRRLQLILFDPRGCGRSGKPGGVYSIEQMGYDVVELLHHLGVEGAHVLGHSMGGRIALAMALNVPGVVKSLILAASGSGAAARPGADCVPGAPFWLIDELTSLGFEGNLRREYVEGNAFFTADFRASHAAFLEAFFRMALEQHAAQPEYIRMVVARHSFEATHRLADVQAPTLVLVGDEDVVGAGHSAQSDVLRTRIPNASFKSLAGQSHGFFWQAPEETNAAILEWVASH
jgi:pimeloyl-ACP methyl ester carboxylesterase